MANIIVNAVGDQCPIPVVKATKALAEMKEAGTLEVHVDNSIAVENLTRLATGKGLKVESEKVSEELYIVRMGVEISADACGCVEGPKSNVVVSIGTDVMGGGDDELGHTLMKGFIYAVSQLAELPKTIIFYNGGAKIPVEGSVSLEDLKAMEAQGVEILTCGTCLNFYGLAEKLAVGSVTNMYSIVEKLNGATNVIKP